ncbi:iron chelate uptake ABC transporter family permease subunit [Rubellimicrobium roseum]|uniref:Iron chelate uptake ABC transporter family permease subunit n=1 Tax=Rubellimicrobium roseum TaxID=687525 RepID=A0A5C4NB37_9RHOB|nr:iron chelate uptake ABC transporter family permease subunit [Rubellimicrobium roseum]TNC66608.1 iron chelate uptake ABC transporter family permease subunit [Rubellimicrobium roseum]
MQDSRLLALAAALLVLCAAFLTLGAQGDWGFILTWRGARLAALLVVGTAVAVATVLFQTVSSNRILTPSVMGFDALFVLLQTGLVFSLGGVGAAALPATARFALEGGLLMGAGLLLFGTLLGSRRPDLHRMVLTGLILGVLFRSLAGFLQRLIDPNDFVVAQASSFASFGAVDTELLGLAALLSAAAAAGAWVMRHRLDVLALGRDTAVGLGLDHRRAVLLVLVLVAALVSVSTALVGPVTFFGLLVTALAHRLMRTHRHALLLPAAALIAGITLVGGQIVVERLLGLTATLGVVVEFLGGLAFLLLVLKEPQR